MDIKVNDLKEYEWSYSRTKGFLRNWLNPQSKPSADFVLVRPKWVGICGSDCYSMEVNPGEFKIGHEWVGVVEQKGPKVKKLNVGDVVTSSATLGCLRCDYCRRGKTNLCEAPLHLGSDKLGALRTAFTVSEKNLVLVKGKIEKLKVLHEVIAVAEEALGLVNTASKTSKEREILIMGGGAVGLLIAVLAREKGLKPTVIEKSDYRLKMIQKRGIECISLAQAIVDKSFERRFSRVIDASSDFNEDTGAFKYLPLFVKREFLVVMVGKYVKLPEIPRSFYQTSGQIVWMRGVTLTTLKKSVARWNPQLKKLFDGVITHTFSDKEVAQAFQLAQTKKGSMKVVIEI